MFEKLRAFADIGRTQGITTTATISIVGALTASKVSVEWYHIVYLTILAAFAHMTINTYIALGDIDLDSHTYVPSRNPVSSGLLSKKEALGFVYGGTIICLALIFSLVLITDYIYVLMAFLCFIPSYI